MKTIALLILATFTLISCKNDDDNSTPTSPIGQLPPATQVGANTAGALVNGDAFLPNNGSVIPLNLDYINQQDFALGISREVGGIFSIIYIGDTQLEEGETYLLKEAIDGTSSYGEYLIQYPLPNGEILYGTKTNIVGELTITNHDYDNAILSGTFWLDAGFKETINYTGEVDENEIIEIREGRFDMEY